MTDITQLLGKDAESLLQHRCITIPSDQLYLPGADYVDRVMVDFDASGPLPAVEVFSLLINTDQNNWPTCNKLWPQLKSSIIL